MMRKQMCATLHIKVAGKSTAGRETAAGSPKSIFVNCVCNVIVQCMLYIVQQPGNRKTAALGWEVVFIGKIGGL